MGPIQLTLTRPATEADTQGWVAIGERHFVVLRPGQLYTRQRTLQRRANWLDYPVEGVAKLDAVSLGPGGAPEATNPILIFFSARP